MWTRIVEYLLDSWNLRYPVDKLHLVGHHRIFELPRFSPSSASCSLLPHLRPLHILRVSSIAFDFPILGEVVVGMGYKKKKRWIDTSHACFMIRQKMSTWQTFRIVIRRCRALTLFCRFKITTKKKTLPNSVMLLVTFYKEVLSTCLYVVYVPQKTYVEPVFTYSGDK